MPTVVDAIQTEVAAERASAAVAYATLLSDPARQTPTGIEKLRAAAEVLGRSLTQMNSDLAAISSVIEAATLARTEAAAAVAATEAKLAVRASLERITRLDAELRREREAHQMCVGQSQLAAQAHGRARAAACGRAANVCHFWRGLGFEQPPDDAPAELKL